MTGSFKFTEYLSEKERKMFNKLRNKLGGKTIYFPYPDKDSYRFYLENRNRKIKQMFRRLKKLGLSNRVIYAELAIRLTCAKHLSTSYLRAIIHGYNSPKR